jgi:hypothetical protein
MEALWKRRGQVRPVAWHRLATRPGPPSRSLPSRPTTQPGREGTTRPVARAATAGLAAPERFPGSTATRTRLGWGWTAGRIEPREAV